jgi:hypothetical protein
MKSGFSNYGNIEKYNLGVTMKTELKFKIIAKDPQEYFK